MNREKLFVFVTDLLYFGFPNGLSIFFARSKKKGDVSVSLKQYKYPIVLRCGTSDFETFDQIFKSREYQLPISISNEGVIIDAGANIGLASIWFTTCYPSTKVIALEPEQSNYDLLVKNTHYYKNILPLKVALWGNDETLRLQDPNRDKWGFTVSVGSEGPEIEGVTVDKLITSYSIARIDLLKIDIEGAEVELFDNPECKWLEMTDSLTVELHDRIRKESSRSFFRTMLKHDFLIEGKGEKIFAFRKN